ncbi:MAG TPA: helix-turn-helix domain-containing protein [Firmicutes bacterium]|nr:helix-turn-helix domain-containing protein [Bacillota bacterium]
MNILIGDKIRELRKLHGITQEQLAEAIGISFQAVSKWENHIALPDITLVPALANYFGVTCDELFGMNLMEAKAQISSLCAEAAKYRECDPEKSRAILEEGLKRYPDNDILLNNLLYVIDYSRDPDKTIGLASHLIDKTDSREVRYDALRFLAYAYRCKGDTGSAVAALEQIPKSISQNFPSWHLCRQEKKNTMRLKSKNGFHLRCCCR